MGEYGDVYKRQVHTCFDNDLNGNLYDIKVSGIISNTEVTIKENKDDVLFKTCLLYTSGAAYKPTISRGKNSNIRWRFGADLGANRKGFQASIYIGLEYSYSFRNGMQVFVMQKNDFVFWTRDHFRNGLLVGVKFPINK